MPLCNRETLVYDLRNVPGTFGQIIEVRNISKKAECGKHADCMAQFKLCWLSEAVISPFRLMTHLWLACCVITMRENNLSGSANLFKGVNVIDTSGLEIFAGSSYRGSICPTGAKIGSSYRAFREIEGSRNRDSTVQYIDSYHE